MPSTATKEPEERQVSLLEAVGELTWENHIVPLNRLPQPIGPPPSRSMILSAGELGILEPVILGAPVGPDDFYEVLDGMRRIWAAREAGLTEIPARIAVGPTKGNAILTLITNEQRSTNPISEYRSITKLADTQFSETEIARLTGMPVQTIRKRMRIRQLVPEFFAMFEIGDLPTALAEELAKLPPSEQNEALHRINHEGEKLTHGLLQDVRSVRREAAVMELLPGLEDLDEMGDPSPEVTRGRALLLIERIRLELIKTGNPEAIRTIDRLLGELEGELNRGGIE